MKTELFAVTNETLLQESINDFIRDKKVLDIKYSISGVSSSSPFENEGIVPTMVYSALIIYQDTENETN